MKPLREYQHTALKNVIASFRAGNKRVVLYAPTGCHAPGTGIMLSSGSIVPVERIRIGDKVMGDDGTNRTVTNLHNDFSEMMKITPKKGSSFVVNLDHILSLVETKSGDVIDISVREYLTKSKWFKHLHKIYRSEAIKKFDELNSIGKISPWLLGVLIGDGSLKYSVNISNNDEPVIKKITIEAEKIGVTCTVKDYPDGINCKHISLTTKRGQKNPLRDEIVKLGLNVNSVDKFIPDCYKYADDYVRSELLAGLLDTDGHYSHKGYDWISASKQLADDVIFLSRSLGLSAYISECKKGCQNGFIGIYWRVSINGDLIKIPCVKHKNEKRGQKKNVLRSGFMVENIGHGEYFGFECDGNHRYLDADFTVHHNSGKSVMAVSLVDFFLRNGKSVAFIANRIGLVHQFSQHLQDAKIEHGIIQGDNTFNIHSKCLVCSIDTLVKRGFPNKVDCLIIDECHFSPAHDAMKKIIFNNPDIRVVGLTATPFAKGMAKPYFELDDEPLFQDMVVTSTISKLIEERFLVDCEIYAPTDPDLTGVKSQRNEFGELDYSPKGLGDAVDKPDLIGDIVDHWFKLAGGKKTVIFATNVNHSRHIVEQFCKRGIKAAHVDGYMDQEEKFPIMQGFEKGDTLIISNVSMLKEGWDMPSCEVMIIAKPTRSLTAWIQMCGRVLRIAHEKTMATIIDHSGTVHRLGFPTDDLPLKLCDGNESKTKAREEDPKEKKDTLCPKCKFIKKSRKCSKCGYEPPIISDVESGDGELGKVSKGKKATMADKQDWYSQFLGWAQINGKTIAQANGRYKSLFGVWPRGLNEIAITPSQEAVQFANISAAAYAKKMQGAGK